MKNKILYPEFKKKRKKEGFVTDAVETSKRQKGCKDFHDKEQQRQK